MSELEALLDRALDLLVYAEDVLAEVRTNGAIEFDQEVDQLRQDVDEWRAA